MYYDIPALNTRILGSVHVIPATAVSLPLWALRAFEEAELVEIEHDHAELEACFVDAATGTLKPWAQIFSKLRQMLAQAAPSLQLGVEGIFAGWLQERGRPPVTYIETGRSFADLLDSVPLADLAKAAAAMDASASLMVPNIVALHSAWDRCDYVALAKLQETSPLASVPSLRRAAFTARNEAWANTIISRGASEKRQLIVVGALHLVGPDSLLDQLVARGLTVNLLIG